MKSVVVLLYVYEGALYELPFAVEVTKRRECIRTQRIVFLVLLPSSFSPSLPYLPPSSLCALLLYLPHRPSLLPPPGYFLLSPPSTTPPLLLLRHPQPHSLVFTARGNRPGGKDTERGNPFSMTL